MVNKRRRLRYPFTQGAYSIMDTTEKGRRMPAIITHHLFGEEASRKLPTTLGLEEEELLAFLLANQGPDPFYFCLSATPMGIRSCHELAEAMHEGHELAALVSARENVQYLPAEDRGVGRAFALGLLAHYLLYSESHAFIGSQVNAICSAGVGLDDSQDQVEALIQSELDTWLLWSSRKQTIADTPAWANLARTPHVSRIGGTIFSQVAWQVFGIKLPPERYERCLRDYELVYRAIDPIGNPRGKMLSGAERLGKRHSLLDALAHTDAPSDDCPSANLACHPWRDPLTGTDQTTSYGDVFYHALEQWPALAQAFVEGDDEALRSLMLRTYQGTPLPA